MGFSFNNSRNEFFITMRVYRTRASDFILFPPLFKIDIFTIYVVYLSNVGLLLVVPRFVFHYNKNMIDNQHMFKND